MKNQSTVKLVSLLVFISLVCGCKDEKSEVSDKRTESLGKDPRIQLRLQLLPGKYALVESVITEQEINMNGQAQKVHMSHITWSEIDASEPSPSGEITCEITTKRIKYSSSPLDMFDTDDPNSMKDNILAQLFSWQLKHKIVLTYGPNGEFIRASGLNEMWDELARQEPSAAQFVNQMKEVMGDTYGAEFLYGNVSTMLPEEPVGVGAIWHNTISKSMPMIGISKYDHENELIKIESTPAGKIAHIKCVGLIQSRGEGNTSIGLVSTHIKCQDMKITGEIQINADTGLMIKQKMVTAGDMEMSMKEPGGKDMSTNVIVKMTTEKTLTPIEQKQ